MTNGFALLFHNYMQKKGKFQVEISACFSKKSREKRQNN
jgi:hypothetical protein